LITLEELAADIEARTKEVAKDRLQRAAGSILLRPDWRRKQVEEATPTHFETCKRNTSVYNTRPSSPTKRGTTQAHEALTDVGAHPADLAHSLQRSLGTDFETFMAP